MGRMRSVELVLLWFFSVAANVSIYDPQFRPDAQCDYLIISAADDGILRQAGRLAALKWEKGLRTRVVNVDSIYANVSGVDSQDRIRNFIREARYQWGTTWVLLMGSFELIPPRTVVAPGDTHQIHSDIYFGCLEGDWDWDRDGIYGNGREVLKYRLVCDYNSAGEYVCDSMAVTGNGLDLWHDVYIGRLPVRNGNEARTLIDKIVKHTYLANPNPYAGRVALLTHSVFGRINGVADGTYYFERLGRPIEHQTSAYGRFEVDRLYEDSVLPSGEIKPDTIVRTVQEHAEYLSRGYAITFWFGHGSPREIETSTAAGPQYFRIPDVEALNSGQFTNMMTISCSVLMTERDTCFARSFLLNPNGGAVSFSGASHLEYLSPSMEHYMNAMKHIAPGGELRIAKASLLGLLEANVSYSDVSRINLYVHQFWGDPEMEIRMRPLTDADAFRFHLEKVTGKWRIGLTPPQDSVLVCIYKPNEVFLRGYTTNGRVEFDTLATRSGMKLTATAPDFLPTVLPVDAADFGPQLMPAEYLAGRLFDVQPRAAGGFSLKVFKPDPTTPVKIELYDVSGRLITRMTGTDSNRMFVGDRKLGAGIYLVRAEIGAKRQVQRVTIWR